MKKRLLKKYWTCLSNVKLRVLAEQLLAIGQAAPGYTAVLNGRFKGGHITRQYGNPAQGIHAVQLEMTQCSYMRESWPFNYLPEVAARVQQHVRRMLEAVLAFVEASGRDVIQH